MRLVLATTGGYQEGRGADISTSSSHFYVENVFEELDSGGEWFYDEAGGNSLIDGCGQHHKARARSNGVLWPKPQATRKLYVQPNGTLSACDRSN